MPEPDFHGLRTQLESEAQPPPFEQIHRRRQRRTRRHVVLSATAVVAVLAVTGTAIVSTPRRIVSPAQQATPTPVWVGSPPPTTYATPPPDSSARPSAIPASWVEGPNGALTALTSRCLGSCDGGAPQKVFTIATSADAGRTWHNGARLDWLAPDTNPDMLGSPQGTLWVLEPKHGLVAVSTDHGQHWVTQSVPPQQDLGNSRYRADVAGDTLWFVAGFKVYNWRSGTDTPLAVGSLPDIGGVWRPLAISGSESLAYNYYATGQPQWFRSDDRGQTWKTEVDPCASSGVDESQPMLEYAVPAPDGSLWVHCQGQVHFFDDHLLDFAIVVSTDHGHSWVSRGHGGAAFEKYTTVMAPITATTAWRWSNEPQLDGEFYYRMTDGATWGLSKFTLPSDQYFYAISIWDMQHAVVFTVDSGYRRMISVYETVNGGATWQAHPITGLG